MGFGEGDKNKDFAQCNIDYVTFLHRTQYCVYMEGIIQCVLCTMSSLLESHKLQCTLIRIVGSHSSKSTVSNLATLIGYKNFRENVNIVHKFHCT